MAKQKQFEQVLEILRAAHPASVSKQEFATQLGEGSAAYRISTYIWEIKNKTDVPIVAVKDGRKVVGYRIDYVAAIPAEVVADSLDNVTEAVVLSVDEAPAEGAAA